MSLNSLLPAKKKNKRASWVQIRMTIRQVLENLEMNVLKESDDIRGWKLTQQRLQGIVMQDMTEHSTALNSSGSSTNNHM